MPPGSMRKHGGIGVSESVGEAVIVLSLNVHPVDVVFVTRVHDRRVLCHVLSV